MHRLRWLILLCAALPWAAASADPPPHQHPVIALILDDLGNQREEGLRSVALPGPVTYAVLPDTPWAVQIASLAHAQGKEVMLHLPMQAVHDRPLGPGGVTMEMSEQAVKRALESSLATIPHVRGVNNHMGSLLTRHPGHMDWLMQVLAEHGDLYFVDSRTTAESVALRVAMERRVPSVDRDVFLDSEPGDPDYVSRQFDQLIAIARRHGMAVGIGHPYPATLEVLESRLGELRAHGIELVPVSELLDLRERRQAWQASLSPSPTAAKN
ncbi:MAG: divergent polysaccharide deacetylase family protein [Chromatiales bacterium]|nr:divergent polysaccharide deacetylase family protein [Chromatiales bacterium]